MTTIPAPHPGRARAVVPTYVLVSAALTPVMVLTGWAFLAAIPVGAMTVASWTDRRVRPLRWLPSSVLTVIGPRSGLRTPGGVPPPDAPKG